MNAAEHRAEAERKLLYDSTAAQVHATLALVDAAREIGDQLDTLTRHKPRSINAADVPPGYFIAPDADGDPCIWQLRTPAEPLCVLDSSRMKGGSNSALWEFFTAIFPTHTEEVDQ